MDAPEVVTAASSHDLKPMDMVDEGIFIRELWWGWSPPDDHSHGWYVAPLVYATINVDGVALKSPAWGESVDLPMKFPMKVIRGATPPAAR